MANDLDLMIPLAQGQCRIGYDGIWSHKNKDLNIAHLDVKIWLNIDLNTIEFDNAGNLDYIYAFGYVYFNPLIWNTDIFGLIYTDKLFEHDVNQHIINAGFATYSVFSYSEQGRQGSNFVDFDVDHNWAYNLKPVKFYQFGLYESSKLIAPPFKNHKFS